MKVVDASALAAVLFEEPRTGEIVERLSGILIAPSLLPFELTNVCLVKCRRDPDQRQRLMSALPRWRNLDVQERPVDHDAVLILALETKLSAYDASYVWLALQFDAELVTLDNALGAAWAARAEPAAGP